MEDNKVTLTLEEYLKMYDYSREVNSALKELKEYLFSAFEYYEEKDTIKFDKYNLNDTKMTNLLKKLFPNEFESQINYLKMED